MDPGLVHPPLRAQRPTERGEATRRRILEVAAVSFARKGYVGSSLNDLIRESGVTKGGFYFHFPSKEALALSVLREKEEDWMARVTEAAMQHSAAIDQLTALPAALLDLYEGDPAARAIQRLTLELSEDPRLAPEMATFATMWVDLTASLIRNAQEQGALRDDCDPVAAAEGAVAAFVGFEHIAAVVSGGAGLRGRVERFADLYLTMLRPLQDADGAAPPKQTDRSA
jgi:AcrR family transcriptional regulator